MTSYEKNLIDSRLFYLSLRFSAACAAQAAKITVEAKRVYSLPMALVHQPTPKWPLLECQDKMKTVFYETLRHFYIAIVISRNN